MFWQNRNRFQMRCLQSARMSHDCMSALEPTRGIVSLKHDYQSGVRMCSGSCFHCPWFCVLIHHFKGLCRTCTPFGWKRNVIRKQRQQRPKFRRKFWHRATWGSALAGNTPDSVSPVSVLEQDKAPLNVSVCGLACAVNTVFGPELHQYFTRLLQLCQTATQSLLWTARPPVCLKSSVLSSGTVLQLHI